MVAPLAPQPAPPFLRARRVRAQVAWALAWAVGLSIATAPSSLAAAGKRTAGEQRAASKAPKRKKPRPAQPSRRHPRPDPHVVFHADADVAPAVQYAALDRDACEAELVRRNVSYVTVESARGVLFPVRLTGPLRGVSFHGEEREARRATSPYEILDCRLVLALDDFAELLARRNVVEVVHLSMYRPPPRRFPSDRIGRRHDGALAIDVARFVREDGSVLDVDQHFNGRIGAETCGPGTGPNPATAEATELRDLVCEAAEARFFHVILTPDYNRKHKDHLHLEVAANVKWFLVH